MVSVILALVTIIILWAVLTAYLSKRYGRDINIRGLQIHFYVPFILVGSSKLTRFVDRLSKRFKKPIGTVFIVISVATMLLTFYILTKSTISYLTMIFIEKVEAPSISPRVAIALPGINPAIPITYGIVGLIIAIVIHELFHGIVARQEGLKIDDSGVLFLTIPLGAYVNVNEKDMENAPPKSKAKIFSAGPAINILFSIIILGALVGMGSFIEAKEGLVLIGGVEGTDAYNYVKYGDLLIKIEDYKIRGVDDLEKALKDKKPGDTINITVLRKEVPYTFTIVLQNKYNFTHASEDYGKPFMGIIFIPFNSTLLAEFLKKPYTGLLTYVSLPFLHIMPLSDPLTMTLSVPNPSVFWALYNMLYWIFWMNIVLGTANALPAYPFDGAGILSGIIEHFIKRDERSKKVVVMIVGVLTVLTYVMFIIPFVIPRIIQ